MRTLLFILILLIGNTAFAQKTKLPLKGYDKIGAYNKKGWAKVEKVGKVGFIDRTGAEVIECIYDEIYPFERGRAKIVKAGKFGLVRESGEVFVEPKYDYIGPFVNGLAIIGLGTRRGLLDENGEEVVEVQ
ncbi:MAG: WG repeat-containing protein [Bacteroidota bacterium]